MDEPLPSPISEPFIQRHRAILKAITWRAIGATTTFGFSMAAAMYLVNDLKAALGISTTVTIIESAGKVLMYYFHERAWDAKVPLPRRTGATAATTDAAVGTRARVPLLARLARDGLD